MIDRALTDIFSDQWRVIIIVSVLLLLMSELGFRFGLRLHRTRDEPRKGQIGGAQGALFGILGLLLGFTFAMAVGRFDHRRGLVMQEANAIGTTYLRASLLPQPHQQAVEDLLRRYVDVRLAFYDAPEPAKIALTEKDAATLLAELWKRAMAAAKESPSPLTATFITALNEVIDLNDTCRNAFRSRIPGPVWLLLLVVAAVGCCVTGYGSGAAGARSALSHIVLPLLIAVVITLIADLGRPRHSFIGVDQRPLLDLKQSLGP